jgi:hypothetical protein
MSHMVPAKSRRPRRQSGRTRLAPRKAGQRQAAPQVRSARGLPCIEKLELLVEGAEAWLGQSEGDGQFSAWLAAVKELRALVRRHCQGHQGSGSAGTRPRGQPAGLVGMEGNQDRDL